MCCLLFLGTTQYFSAPQMLRSARRSSIRSRQKTRLPLFSRRLQGIWQSLFIAATCLLLSLVCVRFCGCRQVNPQPLRLREAIPLFRNSAICSRLPAVSGRRTAEWPRMPCSRRRCVILLSLGFASLRICRFLWTKRLIPKSLKKLLVRDLRMMPR